MFYRTKNEKIREGLKEGYIRYNKKYDVYIDKDGNIFDGEYKPIKTYWNKSDKNYPCFNRNGHRRVFCHRVVAFTWVDGWAPDKVVDHIDNNSANYHPSNLRWCTKQENALYYYREQKNGLGDKS